MSEIELYTDGACSGNPGPGGWAAILIYKDNEKKLSGFVDHTTNNRMELFAVIKGLSALKRACRVKIYSDSAYLINAFSQGRIENWTKNSWKNSKKQPVLNSDLWKQLIAYTNKHEITWIKVKGHADNEYNNECDKMAVEEIKKHTKQS